MTGEEWLRRGDEGTRLGTSEGGRRMGMTISGEVWVWWSSSREEV